MSDRPRIHVFLGAPPSSSGPGMGDGDCPSADWRHLELTWQDGHLKLSPDRVGNQTDLSLEEDRVSRESSDRPEEPDSDGSESYHKGDCTAEPQGQEERERCGILSESDRRHDSESSESVHEYLANCFPAAESDSEGPQSSRRSSANPPLSSHSHFLSTWTLSQALVLRGRHNIQAASPLKAQPPQTPSSSSTPELFSPQSSTPGGSLDLFSQLSWSLKAQEGGVVIEVTTEGILCSQELAQHESSSPPKAKKARVSGEVRVGPSDTKTKAEPTTSTESATTARSTTTAERTTMAETMTSTEPKGHHTLLSCCERGVGPYSVLVAVVHPCHIKEVKVKAGPSAGSLIPLASILVTDQSGAEMKVVLWRRAAFWVLTVSPGDILLITGLQVNEDRWRGETVLQSTFSSILLNLGPISSTTSPSAPQQVDPHSLSSLCRYLRQRRPLLVSSHVSPPQDLNRLPYATLRSLKVNMLVHALLRVTDAHVSTDWRSEAESRCRSALQSKAILTVEQPDGQQGALLLWGAAVDWLTRINRDRASIWDFRVLLVREGLTSDLPELHSTPWSSLQLLDPADHRAEAFIRPHPPRTGPGIVELDVDTLLSQKYSGEVELRIQVINFQFQDCPPSQNAPQPVLDGTSSMDDILEALGGDITYTGCGRCSTELDTDANGIYLPCYACLPHTAVRRYYRPGVLTVSGRGSSSHLCVKAPPLRLQALLEAPPDKLHKSSGSELRHIQVAAEIILSLLTLPKKTVIITVQSHFLCDENSFPISQDFTLLDLQDPS
ncbi:shieldin complex subunit 2 isoform X2 [Cheilinus undulatus]|uniref:shieldin complex subunit 2 isoform X2 n=1 Tax=Cheilinus undulatus TaxID=241271 RepID=UPI001BD1CD1A|nr:shieldin complex subunit 2 isoform X2 [Cheilinus undulatus]